MSSVTIKVNNKEYTLKGEEKEEYLHTVANYVDKKIKNIMENNTKLSTSEAAILTAMNVADDLFKCGEYNEKLYDDIEELKKKEKALNERVDELKSEITKVNEEKEQLIAKFDDIKPKDQLENADELNKQISIMTEETKKYVSETKRLKEDNKQLKFNLQSSKYKLMDLENKYLESQIELAKAKKEAANTAVKEGKKETAGK